MLFTYFNTYVTFSLGYFIGKNEEKIEFKSIFSSVWKITLAHYQGTLRVWLFFFSERNKRKMWAGGKTTLSFFHILLVKNMNLPCYHVLRNTNFKCQFSTWTHTFLVIFHIVFNIFAIFWLLNYSFPPPEIDIYSFSVY